MSPLPGPVETFSLVASLFYLGLAAFVIRINARRPINQALAAFALFEGLGVLVDVGLQMGFVSDNVHRWVFYHVHVFAGIAVVAIALLYPTRVGASGAARVLALPVALAFAYFALVKLAGGIRPEDGAYFGALAHLSFLLPSISHLLPARLAMDPASDAHARPLAFLGTVFYLVPGISYGFLIILSARSGFLLADVAVWGILLGGTTFLWLLASARASTAEAARAARDAALASVAIPLAVMVIGVVFADADASAWSVVHGIAGILFMAALVYVVLRHQVLGLDVKVRWTLSRGTIAAAFVAAFFVAGEGAQILFGQGNEWVGLIAAGALVFAMAPLQRAAERLAEKAIPSANPASPSEGRGEASYRKAVRLAIRDRRLTREEEAHLHELARDMGIDGARAHAILIEVEQESARGEERPTA